MSRVLVADEDAEVRTGWRSVLAEDGHEAVEADSAEAVLRRAREVPPDLALMSIEWPDWSGPMLLRELRRELQRPLPAVFLVWELSREARLRALEAGAAAVFRKAAVAPQSRRAIHRVMIRIAPR
jgi:CheY-like chemotaxis protein